MDQINKSLIDEGSTSIKESQWFLDYQKQALDQIEKLKAPKIERFDYSDWGLFKEEKPAKGRLERSNEQAEMLIHEADFILKSSGELERLKEENKAIELLSFEELLDKNHQDFKELYLASDFTQFKDQFNAFNLAYLTTGIFIRIPKGVQVKAPIQLAFLDEKSATKNKNHQVFIYAEENSAIELLETYASLGDSKEASKINVHVHIQTEAGANVKYTAIDELDKNTQAFFRRTAKIGTDSTLELALGMMSDGDMIEDIQVDLLGTGSSADVKAVAISHNQQRQVVNSKVINHGAHSVGNIYQHGVVLDQATLTFNGLGDVLKNAKNSDAQQESRILMLSEEARADTNPILLIDEYELTAGHAASISRVDEGQLYYLMSRGLDRVDAEKLVIRGFLGSVLSAISVEDVRKHLIETIERKLSAL